MTEDIEITEEVVSENGRAHFMELAHKVLLASIGVVAVAQEEIESFVNRLIERGEIAEKDGRSMIKDILEKRRASAESAQKRAQSGLDKRVEEILDRLNVPTKSDIDDLGKKITTLTRKVDQLKKQLAEQEKAAEAK